MPTLNRQPIPILVYHQIAVAPPKGSPFRGLYVSPAAFARQMAWLKRWATQGLSMSALQPYLRGELSGKVVGITFDDGYLNNLSACLAGAGEAGFFVDLLCGQRPARENQCLGRGHRHPADAADGRGRNPPMGGGRAGDRLAHASARQPAGNRRVGLPRGNGARQNRAGGRHDRPVEHFCYPYGHLRGQACRTGRTLGFATATTTQRSRCHGGMDLLQLPRVPVLRSTTLPVFWLKIATAYEDRRKK
jgi:hypothetical protein